MQDSQVEQDLVVSRALVEIFSHPVLRESVAFRGGTALYKLYLRPPARYSEDIDLVQVNAGPAGELMNAMRDILDHWLGVPQWRQNEQGITFNYRFDSEDVPPIRLRLKVEINTREHFAVYGYTQVPFVVDSRWYEQSCEIVTYELEKLLATKLRALYQRRKGRDLFDLETALRNAKVDSRRIVAAFLEYMAHEGNFISRAQFEQNIDAKLRDRQFSSDIEPLLSVGYRWNLDQAAKRVSEDLIEMLPGEPWKGRG